VEQDLVAIDTGGMAEANASAMKPVLEQAAADETYALEMANRLAAASQFDSAAAVLKSRLATSPTSLPCLLTLAQIESRLGRRDASLDALLDALIVDPTSGIAWSSLVRTVRSEVETPNDPYSLASKVVSVLAERKSVGEARQRHRAAAVVARAALEALPVEDRIVVLDAGARDAHSDPRWRLLPPERLAFYGFEPDEAECERLNAELKNRGIGGGYFPVGLWDRTGQLPFHVNRASGGSSFLRQNLEVTDRWKFENPSAVSYATDMFFEDHTVEATVTDIASWGREAQVGRIDFIKLNVQGGEIAILRGIRPQALAAVQGILVEVAFVESYCDRPMFSDVDAYIRGLGFTFFDLLAHHYIGRAASPYHARHASHVEGRLSQLRSSWGQLIEGHALYLRDPVKAVPGGVGLVADSDTMAVLRLTVIADVFGQTEFALEVLAALDAHAQSIGDARMVDTAEAIRSKALEGLGWQSGLSTSNG
jgi:FkbM family methyltransferase